MAKYRLEKEGGLMRWLEKDCFGYLAWTWPVLQKRSRNFSLKIGKLNSETEQKLVDGLLAASFVRRYVKGSPSVHSCETRETELKWNFRTAAIIPAGAI